LKKSFVDLTVQDILGRLDSYKQSVINRGELSNDTISNADLLQQLGELREYTHLNSRLNVLPSHRGGLIKPVANFLLRKLFFAVKIFLTGVISAQERFNQMTLKMITSAHARLERLEVGLKPELSELEDIRQNLQEQNLQIEALLAGNSKAHSSDNLPIDYVAFENKFRGDVEDIYNAQKRYLTYFVGCKRVLDIGCGRGEFLKLLRENGVSPIGIDIDQDMVNHCHSAGLEVHLQDALTYLRDQPDNSLDGIVAFQVAEHLANRYLIGLINESHRVLAPGRHLILETLNPQSLNIFVNQFYLDLTHEKPVHPKTLAFLAEQAGFDSIDTQYFSLPPDGTMLEYVPQPDDAADEVMRRNIDKLNHVLYGFQDYAIIARKG